VRQITAQTTRIRELESELAELVKRYAPQLLAERGCGALSAAKLIGEIAGADRFATDSKLTRTSGAAPIPASSGNTQRHRLDRGGNRQLNCALHRLAVNKGNWDPEAAAYLARKQAEGKSRKEALRCLKRFLARRVWNLLRAPWHDQATRSNTNITKIPAPVIGTAPMIMPCLT
jgi:transposase